MGFSIPQIRNVRTIAVSAVETVFQQRDGLRFELADCNALLTCGRPSVGKVGRVVRPAHNKKRRVRQPERLSYNYLLRCFARLGDDVDADQLVPVRHELAIDFTRLAGANGLLVKTYNRQRTRSRAGQQCLMGGCNVVDR